MAYTSTERLATKRAELTEDHHHEDGAGAQAGASAALLARLADGGGEPALRALYRAHADELFGFAVSRLGDRGLAEELVQDVFTRVWRRAGDFDPHRATARTWLYGIARNALVDFERRRGVRPALAGQEPAEAADQADPFAQAMLRWQIRSALARLSPEHREVIRLAQFRGMPLREIARETGLPIGTVKSRLYYALHNLRLILEEMGVTP